IRDGHVTGVQTCALPIFIVVSIESAARGGSRIRQGGEPAEFLKVHFEVKSHTVTEAYLVQILLGNRNGFKSRSRNAGRILSRSRSEERRVGKELRCMWLM